MTAFEPSMAAARARLDAVQPEAYARTRNALDGAVTHLSPYLTHGFLSLQAVYAAVHARHHLGAQHKLVFELGWRAYYRHVWAHRGEGIRQSLHAGLLPDAAYLQQMPDDVLQARTGIAVIDQAVRTLYATGYLHNHARMWLASYLVHVRKVHWHAGAQWMLGQLLDGDLASNHLSWQWVAGTGSSKPYLFNAENVAKYAAEDWHSPGTVIDTSYEALDRLARHAAPAPSRPVRARQTAEGVEPPVQMATPPSAAWGAPDSTVVAGRDIWLQHPWSLGATPPDPQALVVGVAWPECHAHSPWSAGRWDFVTRGLQAQTAQLWWADAAQMAQALQGARSVQWLQEPHAAGALARMHSLLRAAQGGPVVTAHEPPGLFEAVPQYRKSFTQWWRLTRLAPQGLA